MAFALNGYPAAVMSPVCRACDAALRDLVDVFKMTDVNSAQRGERAMLRAYRSRLIPTALRRTCSSGRASRRPRARPERPADGNTCLPNTTNVNFKAKVGTGVALTHSRSVPGVHANTVIDSSHRPPR